MMQSFERKKKEEKNLNSVRENLLNQETRQFISFEYVRKSKWWYTQGLLDVINNPTKFQCHRIRRQIFLLKLFDTAMTLK